MPRSITWHAWQWLYCTIILLLIARADAATPTPDETRVGRRSINNGIRLKIMPLGASIVWGEDSTDGNGFRLRLREMLESDGNNVTYVGTVFHGNMTNNAVEAYPGRTIREVDDLALQSGAYDYIPNVFVVHLGTNDCEAAAKNETVSEAAGHFSTLLANIKQKDADAVVIASTLIHNLVPSVDECIVALNAHLPEVVRNASANGQKVTLVDMHNAVPVSDINTTDATHPNDAGYDIMAEVWYEGFLNVSAMISAPNAEGKAAPTSPSPLSTVTSAAASSAAASSTPGSSTAVSSTAICSVLWVSVLVIIGGFVG